MSVFVSAPKAKQAFVLHCLLQPDAAIALDNMDMIFTTGGGANFAPTSSDYCGQNDSDAAISGDIDDEEESKMEILVEGEGTLTFWWKVDSEAGCDELQFIADGSKE
ncbi:MAG: hypothetical protein JW837_08850, partial [Sedimentisphaerales bacterium]|nr:hypothetical protein [Sedimentisphaerales bacterium]